MTASRVDLSEQLRVDVYVIYKAGLGGGFEPRRIPGLAELARALAPSELPDRRAVVVTLKQAIYRAGAGLLPVFHKVDRPRILAGLETLFGLADTKTRGLMERADDAGSLLGYPNGYEGLRSASLKGVKRFELALSEVARQLRLMADEAEFSYEEFFAPFQDETTPEDSDDTDNRDVSQVSQNRLTELCSLLRASLEERHWLALQSEEVRQLYSSVHSELRQLSIPESGLDGVDDTGTLLHIARLTHAASGTSRRGVFTMRSKLAHQPSDIELLDAFFLFIFKKITVVDELQPGFAALLNVHQYRSASPDERKYARVVFFDLRPEGDHGARVEHQLLILLSLQIVKVAVRLEGVSTIAPNGILPST